MTGVLIAVCVVLLVLLGLLAIELVGVRQERSHLGRRLHDAEQTLASFRHIDDVRTATVRTIRKMSGR